MIIVGIVMNGIIVLIFYSYKIYKTLKESIQNLNAHTTVRAATSTERNDMKLFKTSFTVVCVFLITWGPASVIVIVEIAGCFIARDNFTAITYLMFTLSSLVNTVIYGIMNPLLKAAFKRASGFGR